MSLNGDICGLIINSAWLPLIVISWAIGLPLLCLECVIFPPEPNQPSGKGSKYIIGRKIQ